MVQMEEVDHATMAGRRADPVPATQQWLIFPIFNDSDHDASLTETRLFLVISYSHAWFFHPSTFLPERPRKYGTV